MTGSSLCSHKLLYISEEEILRCNEMGTMYPTLFGIVSKIIREKKTTGNGRDRHTVKANFLP